MADSGNTADSGSLIKQETVLADSAKLKDTVKTDSVRSGLSVFTVDSVKKKSESTKETHENFAQKAAFSQEIKVFDCVIVSRPDIRLNIELEVICKNQKAETEILVRKNDIQTIVRSVLKNKELGDIKKGSLQEELVKAINGIFDMDLLAEVEFRSFHIEKVK